MEKTPTTYPVALKWDQGPKKPKQLKNKLQIYFQNNAKSGGGECDIQDTDCSQGYILIHFKEERAQKRVLQKKLHELKGEVKGEGILHLEVFPVDEIKPCIVSPSASSLADNAAAATPSSQHADQPAAAEGHTEGQYAKRTNLDTKTSTVQGEDPPQSEVNDDVQSSDSNKRRKHHYDDVINRESSGNEGGSRSGPQNSGTGDKEDQNSESVTKQMSKMDVGHNDTPGAEKRSTSGPLDSEDGDSGRITHQSFESSGAWSSLHGDGSAENTFREEKGRYDQGYQGDPRVNKGGEASSHNDSKYEAENPGNYSDTNASARPINLEPRPPLRRPKEFFTAVIAILPTDLYNKTLREKMAEMFPAVKVNKSSDGTEVKGTFKQIEAVYKYLQQELSGEMPSATQSEESGQEMKADHVCVPTALCEYVMEVYQRKVQDMEGQYKVKLVPEAREDGTTNIKFIPQGTGSSVEAAKERFTEKVQTTMNDWCQETLDFSSAHMPFSEIKLCLRSQFSNILVIQEGKKIVLRGPKEELIQAKRCLEKGQYEPSHPPRTEPSYPPRPVSISNRDMKTEIPVDARHLDILRKLKNQEICDIEKKYNVMLQEKKERNGSMMITFRPVNGSPDLAPHAAHSFITLLQKTFFNIMKKVISVKSDVSQVSVLEQQLKMGGVNVIMEYSNGSVVIIGHTSHVAFAEEMLTGLQKVGRAPAAAPPRGDTQEPMDTSESATSKPKPEEEEDKCPVCQYEIKDKVTFPKCKHGYCKPCLKELMSHKPMCAICGVTSGEVRGNQPEGTMTWRASGFNIPGFPGCGTIEISYSFPSGTQQENHPHPGRPYYGTSRIAYLPDNPEGRDVLRLLKKAFDRRLIFTVGDSRTTGASDTVTWNDVHHKTSRSGGPQCFGYPDPDYLKRVRDELKAKGVE